MDISSERTPKGSRSRDFPKPRVAPSPHPPPPHVRPQCRGWGGGERKLLGLSAHLPPPPDLGGWCGDRGKEGEDKDQAGGRET